MNRSVWVQRIRRALLLFPLLASACEPVTPYSEINLHFQSVLDGRQQSYRLKDGDSIDIKLYNRGAELNQNGLVLADGTTDLFYLDNYVIAGKTLPELEGELRNRLAGVVRDTDVSIQVTPRGEEVYLVGQFERPHTVPLTTEMTLTQAIAKAGGLRVTGDTDWALLRRPFLDRHQPAQFRIDLTDNSQDLFLLPGDQVVLERNFLAGVVNYIREFILGIFPPQVLVPSAAAAL